MKDWPSEQHASRIPAQLEYWLLVVPVMVAIAAVLLYAPS